MVTIGFGTRISSADVVAVAHGAAVTLSNDTVPVLQQRRMQIERAVRAQPHPAYGFNRGFGHNVDVEVPPERLTELQRNIVRSHASGVGPDTPIPVARAAMLLRAQSLSQGHSGVSFSIVESLVAFLNHQITPVIPQFGSVGASGDLAPLSHMALALIGEGEVWFEGERRRAAEVLQEQQLPAVVLGMKEELALTNGVQFSTAYGVLLEDKLRQLLKVAVLATSITGQVMLGSDRPYAAELHRLRPHPGAELVARWLVELSANSPIRESHRSFRIDGEIQDPYNLRCAPQIIGTCFDLLQEARATFEIEINSVTDNPLLFPDPLNSGEYTAILSGGHFHGMPVAVKLYNLVQVMAIVSRLSNMRCVRFVDEGKNKGLGSDLVWPLLDAKLKSICSGTMIPEYVSAALTNFIWGAAMPSHLFSLSTDAGQEDHVSMSAGLAVRIWETVPRLAEVLAIELAFGAQAAAVRKVSSTMPSKSGAPPELLARAESFAAALRADPICGDFIPQIELPLGYKRKEEQRLLSPIAERVLSKIAEVFPIVTEDRALSEDLQALAALVMDGSLLALTSAAGFMNE